MKLCDDDLPCNASTAPSLDELIDQRRRALLGSLPFPVRDPAWSAPSSGRLPARSRR